MENNHTIKTQLPGGREGKIFKIGNLVSRPLNPWTPTIHAYLNHLHQQGIDFVPKPHSIDPQAGVEQVSFVEGEVCNYPLNAAFASETALISAAKLLRKLHDASIGFLNQLTGDEIWMLPKYEPAEIICYADYAPYNVVVKNQHVVGIIDFDTCHPNSRIWDIAYAIYRWAPISRPDADDIFGTSEQHISRAKIFCNAYQMDAALRRHVVPIMIKRLQKMVDYITAEAANGNQDFIANMRDGHHIHYLKDIDYIKANAKTIANGLL
ncbi:MAG: aminoglycoside phosphotransferase family protein [OCS116 cluster bacterium]|nr:aminoglycoside phosphotransferase family protein [OCS116 cluster bacterium]